MTQYINKSTVDVEKFICGIIEAFPAFKEDGKVPCMYKEALAKQGLEYRNGEIVIREDKEPDTAPINVGIADKDRFGASLIFSVDGRNISDFRLEKHQLRALDEIIKSYLDEYDIAEPEEKSASQALMDMQNAFDYFIKEAEEFVKNRK